MAVDQCVHMSRVLSCFEHISIQFINSLILLNTWPAPVNKTSSGNRGMHYDIKAFWSSSTQLDSVSQSKHPRGDASANNQEAQLNPAFLSWLFCSNWTHWSIPEDIIPKLTCWIYCSCLGQITSDSRIFWITTDLWGFYLATVCQVFRFLLALCHSVFLIVWTFMK